MEKMLISIPSFLAIRLRAVFPTRQRSKIIASLLEEEIKKREQSLYECAMEVENDQALAQEMQDWDITLQDGLTDEQR